MLDDPLTIPVPTDPLERIHALARDLAYGAATKMWSTRILLDPTGDRTIEEYVTLWGYPDLEKRVLQKWQNTDRPPLDVLAAFGYLVQDLKITDPAYDLTEKAFALLERPAIPPSVFISYSRRTSSTFGLLIECRLRSVGVRAFIDRSLDPGEGWRDQLIERVRGCNRFIVLLAAGTLASPYCCEEIRWARDFNILTIPIWQPNFDPNEAGIDTELCDYLTGRHSIRILEESAESYYNATESLMNRLGYIG
jgi:hypothetical protein